MFSKRVILSSCLIFWPLSFSLWGGECGILGFIFLFSLEPSTTPSLASCLSFLSHAQGPWF